MKACALTSRSACSAFSVVGEPSVVNGRSAAGPVPREFPRPLPLALVIVVAVSLVVITFVFFGTPQALSPVYYALVTVVGIAAFRGGRGPRTREWLQSLPGPPIARAIVLGFLAVVIEETIVGTLFALTEGFTLAGWAERVGQFIGFNVFAFAGPIFGLTVAARILPGLALWHLFVAGGWGLYAESVFARILGAPIAALLIAGPTIAVYSVILAPLVLSLPERPGRSRWWHPFVAWALMFAFSIPAILVLGALRAASPEAFPPCEYIACP